MITPLEIQNKEFDRKMRGYDQDQVDEFLDRITDDYEKLYRENASLKDRVKVMEDKLKHHSDMEASLHNTLIMAQNTAEEVTQNAQEKARLIIAQAEEEARRAIERANREIVEINKQYQEIKKQMYIFKTRFKTLLEAQLETVDALCDEIEENE